MKDIFTGLKALQRPSARAAATSAASALADASHNFRSASAEIPEGSARLAEILGASAQCNRFGEHLLLRRWFSEAIGDAPPDSFDPSALRLLAPDATPEVDDPQ